MSLTVRHRGALALASGIVALSLSACSHPSSGQVVSKDHHPAWVNTVMQCGSFNQQGVCTVWIPVPQYIPESWTVDLVNGEERWDESVSKAEWDALNVGDTWAAADADG